MRPREAPCSISPAGLRVFAPGWAQWWWGQQGRGVVFCGSFLSASAVAAFAWGTPAGLAFLAFAFGTEVVSVADALRQSVFPFLGRWAALAAAAGLSLAVFAPVLAVASQAAWPGMPRGTAAEGYLVNRWAYRGQEPGRDDQVWFRASEWGEPRLGKVVAGGGQEVQWSGNALRAGGVRLNAMGAPFRSVWPPTELAYRVPEGHVLILPEVSPTTPQRGEGLLIVNRDQVMGRAWAQYYPVRERKLL